MSPPKPPSKPGATGKATTPAPAPTSAPAPSKPAPAPSSPQPTPAPPAPVETAKQKPANDPPPRRRQHLREDLPADRANVSRCLKQGLGRIQRAPGKNIGRTAGQEPRRKAERPGRYHGRDAWPPPGNRCQTGRKSGCPRASAETCP